MSKLIKRVNEVSDIEKKQKQREYIKEYRKKHREEINDKSREYYKRNRETKLANMKLHYELMDSEKKKELLERKKKDYQENKERHLQYFKKYRKENKEKIDQKRRERYQKKKKELEESKESLTLTLNIPYRGGNKNMDKFNIITETFTASKNKVKATEAEDIVEVNEEEPKQAMPAVREELPLVPQGVFGVSFIKGTPNFRGKKFEVELTFMTSRGPLVKTYIRTGFTDLDEIVEFEEENRKFLDRVRGLPSAEEAEEFLRQFGFVEIEKVRDIPADFHETPMDRPRLNQFDDVEESLRARRRRLNKK